MIMTNKILDEQLRELQDCICIYAMDLLWEPKANKADMVKAVIEGITIWDRGIDNKFKEDLRDEDSQICDCIERSAYDKFHDSKATKLQLWIAIDAGLSMWVKGMKYTLKEEGKL